MDAHLPEHSGDPVVVTGAAAELPPAGALSHDADPLPFLRVRKTAKFLSKQDRLALAAAARAAAAASLAAEALESRTLIAMGVGPIPFQEEEARAVAEHSAEGGAFSVGRFCREAYEEVNPMLLFACLPNMPAYHISANLGIRGGYYLTYPSCAETYLALRHAVDALRDGRFAAALFGAVTDQQNFLVRNHHLKAGQALPSPDCACFLVLETLASASARGAPVLARLERLDLFEHSLDNAARQSLALHECSESGEAVGERPREPRRRPSSRSTGATVCDNFFFGPVNLPLAVAQLIGAPGRRLVHRAPGASPSFESEWRT